MDSRRFGIGMLDPAGNDSYAGDLFGIIFARINVRLPVRKACGTRLVVGPGLLYRGAELAIVLDSRCHPGRGNPANRPCVAVCRQGVCLCDWLPRGVAGAGADPVRGPGIELTAEWKEIS